MLWLLVTSYVDELPSTAAQAIHPPQCKGKHELGDRENWVRPCVCMHLQSNKEVTLLYILQIYRDLNNER